LEDARKIRVDVNAQSYKTRVEADAEAEKLRAEADKLHAEADKLRAEAEKLHAEAEHLKHEIKKIRGGQQGFLIFLKSFTKGACIRSYHRVFLHSRGFS